MGPEIASIELAAAESNASGLGMISFSCVFFVLALLASSTVLTAQQHHHHRTEGGDWNAVLENLGAVHMPISCAVLRPQLRSPFRQARSRILVPFKRFTLVPAHQLHRRY
jgi:hypothetical protein